MRKERKQQPKVLLPMGNQLPMAQAAQTAPMVPMASMAPMERNSMKVSLSLINYYISIKKLKHNYCFLREIM